MAAQVAIERQLAAGRRAVRVMVRDCLGWLGRPEGRSAAPADAQHRFSVLRLLFNMALTQLNLFADAMTHRSEHDVGVWLA